jgi:hypothetical protein
LIGLSRFIAKIIAGIISIYDASNLRNRVYSIQSEHEIMWTALDDIARMYNDHPSSEMAKRTLEQIENKYGR